jgi:hypothetical protein
MDTRLNKVLDNVLAWLERKTYEAYKRQLWQAVLDLYRGGSVSDFEDSWAGSIEEQLNRAWREGARSVEVDPKDFEEEDIAEIEAIIVNEFGYVSGLAAEIVQAAKDEAGFDAFRSRVDIWANRYNDVVNRAVVWFGDRENIEWIYGDTEHCKTCEALNGIVAWAKEWELAGVVPQNPDNPVLECRGWRCQCRLEPTDKRRTRNAFDRIMEAIA